MKTPYCFKYIFIVTNCNNRVTDNRTVIAQLQCLLVCCVCSLFSSSTVVCQMLQVSHCLPSCQLCYVCLLILFTQSHWHHQLIYCVLEIQWCSLVTDTGRLVWAIISHNNRHSFHSPEKINISVLLNIFTLTLLSVTRDYSYYVPWCYRHQYISVYSCCT